MNRKIITLLIVSTTSAILSAGVYVYVHKNLSDNQREVSDLYTKSLELKSELDELHNIESNLKETLVYGNRLSQLFIKPDFVVDFIQSVESVLNTGGATGSVESVSEYTSPDLDSVGKEKLHLVIGASGDWSSLNKVIALLERLPYRSSIESFSLVYGKVDKTPKSSKEKITVDEWKLKVDMFVWAVKPDEVDQTGEVNSQ